MGYMFLHHLQPATSQATNLLASQNFLPSQHLLSSQLLFASQHFFGIQQLSNPKQNLLINAMDLTSQYCLLLSDIQHHGNG